MRLLGRKLIYSVYDNVYWFLKIWGRLKGISIMGEKKDNVEEIRISRTEDFIEILASGVVVAFSNDGLFILEFIKPDAVLVADSTGRIKGFRGGMRSCARIYISPITAKNLLKSLSEQLKNYEKKFGEIRVIEESHE